jgi:CheY-like chemotaxis protein
MVANVRAIKPADILVVDDDSTCQYLASEAVKAIPLRANLYFVGNGEECMDFLHRRPPYSDVPVPDLILLDIEMPVMDGRQVLAEIVKDESLKHLPVVVLTSRDEHTEVLNMHRLRCNSYVCKPLEFDRYMEIIKGIVTYWLSVATLPSVGR